jgi:hypothetical protein
MELLFDKNKPFLVKKTTTLTKFWSRLFITRKNSATLKTRLTKCRMINQKKII